MKTGEVREHEDGTPYLEADGWTPWLYHAPENELERYYQTANALMMKLERMPPAVRVRLKRIEIRCPVKGCLLATVYWMSRRPTAEELEHWRRNNVRRAAHGQPLDPHTPGSNYYFYVGRTVGGSEVYDILFYGFSRTSKDKARGCTCCRIAYWRAGCRHGTASLDRQFMGGMFSIAERVHNFAFTEEQAVARLPEHLRPFWGKRVFHPEPAAWHPKAQRPRDRPGQRLPSTTAPRGGRR